MRQGTSRPAIHRWSLLGALALALPLVGCYGGDASGVVAVRHYAVRDFTALAVSSDGMVRVVPGEFAVSVSGETNVLPTVRVERHGDTLVLARAVDWIDGVRPTVSIEYRVSMPTLRRLQVSGPGTVAVRGMQSSSGLKLEATGSGEIRAWDVAAEEIELTATAAGAVSMANVRASRVRCSIRGSSRVLMDGAAATLVLEASGSGLYRGSYLRAATVKATLNGAGQALVWAQEKLEAQVGGRGRLRYRGAPVVASTVARGGTVQPLGAVEP